ncbi:MAG: hypothetical protein IJY24_00235 [Clostridia bacterium]|nr:hypothetical protein [Clostridia bacterium]
MTELEKIAYARSFIDKLANGINPLDDTPIADTDIANNIRISRCFFFVSDILRQVVENGGVEKPKKVKRGQFSILPEQLMRFEYSDAPISLTDITERINALVDTSLVKKLSYKQIAGWLVENGILEISSFNTQPVKVPTSDGEMLGITLEHRSGYRGEYIAVMYNRQAQAFIVDNLEAILAQ